MKCFKCGAFYSSCHHRELRELAKGSPTRGKNVKYVTVKYKQFRCSECQSGEIIWG